MRAAYERAGLELETIYWRMQRAVTADGGLDAPVVPEGFRIGKVDPRDDDVIEQAYHLFHDTFSEHHGIEGSDKSLSDYTDHVRTAESFDPESWWFAWQDGTPVGLLIGDNRRVEQGVGYVRSVGGVFSLTTRTLELGTSYISALGMWEVARPHLTQLVSQTGESSSMSQLDGSDIVYTARVPVAKIIAFSVKIGTLFPATATSMGRVLLADKTVGELDEILARPSRSGIIPRVTPTRGELDESLALIRERGWAMSDEMLSVGIRSIAAPVRDATGRTAAAMNVTVHAAETSIERLTTEYLPLLLATSAAVSEEWSNLSMLPITPEQLPHDT